MDGQYVEADPGVGRGRGRSVMSADVLFPA